MAGEGGGEAAGAAAGELAAGEAAGAPTGSKAPAAAASNDDYDDADLQRPAKRERTGAADASSEKAPAADESSEKAPAADESSEKAPAADERSEKAPAADESSEKQPTAITCKTISDMFPLETIAGGIIAVEPDEWIENGSCVPLDFDLKNTKDYFFMRLLSDDHLFVIKDGPFKNCMCCGITTTGTHLQEWSTWDNWRDFGKTGERPKNKYLMLVFAQLYLSGNKIQVRACSGPAAHRVGEFRKIPKNSRLGERAADVRVHLEDHAFRLHEMVAIPAIQELSRMTYESTRGTFQSTVVTCTHPTMHLRTARSEIELKFEIRSMLEKSFQDRYTDILKQFLVTQVQKEYITEQWAGKTNQLRALLLRSTADILEMHEDFEFWLFLVFDSG